MATPRIGRARNAHLYVQEHIAASGLSDETIANRIEVSRQTVFRWRKGHRKVDTVALASALGIRPEDFFRPPERPSLDHLAEGLDQESINKAAGYIEGLKSARKAG